MTQLSEVKLQSWDIEDPNQKEQLYRARAEIRSRLLGINPPALPFFELATTNDMGQEAITTMIAEGILSSDSQDPSKITFTQAGLAFSGIASQLD
jgi:hypothetical protein